MNTRTTIIVATILGACTLWAASPAAAGEGEVVVLPNMGMPKNGLILTLDTQWVSSPGYRPIHWELRTDTGLPSKKDRRLTLEFMPQTNWNRSQRVVGEMVLPQGQSMATGHLLVPQASQWWSASITTSENGTRLKDLSTQYVQVSRNNNGFNMGQPTMLVIDSDAPTLLDRAAAGKMIQNLRNSGRPLPPDTYDLPDIRGLWQWNPSQQYSGMGGNRPIDDVALINQVHEAGNIELLPPEQLPRQWIAFSSVDLIFLSYDDLLDIRRTEESLCEALKQWTASGGNLVVYDLGYDYQRLRQLEAIIDLKSRSSVDILDRWEHSGSASELTTTSLNSYADQEWQVIRQNLRNHPDAALKKSEQELTVLEAEYRANTVDKSDWVPIRVLGYGHGKIVAFPEPDPFPGSYAKWQRLNNAIKPISSWNAKTGIDLDNGDQYFLAYAIPGVGLPPVHTFRLLITLFVIVIGPVNYLLLKRRKRLFLLLVTVPLGAAIVTGSLFSYALIKDGLSVKARVHSYTSLDQRAGLASSWSRQTYFASLPPSRGLSYPLDATVHSIYDNSYNTRRSQQGSRTLEWSDDHQRLRRGYLGSRTTAEFLVANSTPIDPNVTLRFKQQAAGKPPQVTNSLGVPIEKLLLLGEDGSSYWAENIKADESATPQAKVLVDAMENLKRLAQANQPTDPYYAQQGNSFFGYNRNRWNTPQTVNGQGLLGYGKYTSLIASQAAGQWLEPGEFIAIVPRSPFVPLGVNVRDEEASFHVIRGRYVPD